MIRPRPPSHRRDRGALEEAGRRAERYDDRIAHDGWVSCGREACEGWPASGPTTRGHGTNRVAQSSRRHLGARAGPSDKAVRPRSARLPRRPGS